MRRKIDIKLITEKSKRHTTFTKRRKGLAKKAEEFCRISDSTAMLVTFSSAGNCYCLGHPDVNLVLERYFTDSSSAFAVEARTSRAEERVPSGEEEKEEALREVQKRILDAAESGRWVEALEGLGVDELDEVSAELENMRLEVEALEREIAVVEEKKSGDSGRSC